MRASGRCIRTRRYLLLGLVPAAICLYLLAGCGGESSTKPAGLDDTQRKKMQEYMGGYKESLIAEAKSRAKAKSKDAEKKP